MGAPPPPPPLAPLALYKCTTATQCRSRLWILTPQCPQPLRRAQWRAELAALNPSAADEERSLAAAEARDGDGSAGPGGAGHPNGSERSRGGSLAASRADAEPVLEHLSQPQLRARVVRLERELQEERARTVALEEEKRRPLNVHRWFALETTDPAKMEAIKRVRSLTKQLVDANEAIARADAATAKKRELCAKVQALLVRSGQAVRGGGSAAGGGGGDDGSVTLVSEGSAGAATPVQERVAQFGAMLRERQGRLDALAAELDMYQQQVAADGEGLASLERQKAELNEAWFADCRRRREAQASANREAFDAAVLDAASTGPAGYPPVQALGGGASSVGGTQVRGLVEFEAGAGAGSSKAP